MARETGILAMLSGLASVCQPAPGRGDWNWLIMGCWTGGIAEFAELAYGKWRADLAVSRISRNKTRSLGAYALQSSSANTSRAARMNRSALRNIST